MNKSFPQNFAVKIFFKLGIINPKFQNEVFVGVFTTKNLHFLRKISDCCETVFNLILLRLENLIIKLIPKNIETYPCVLERGRSGKQT